MQEHGKSYSSIVPLKLSNKSVLTVSERSEGSELTKCNSFQQTKCVAQCRESLQNALERIRQSAAGDKTLRHHVYNLERLREEYYNITRYASPGVDVQTCQEYGEDLENNLQDLSRRLSNGCYRAKPVKRAYIPKFDGHQGPIGITTLEDKIVQRSVTTVLNAVYESDFKGFSYGFRPGGGAHNALDAVTVGILKFKVGWVLDADIRGFFDTIDRG